MESLLYSFRDSTRRNIKKAINEGENTSIFTSLESVRQFYRLNCLTRKYHGLPPQPYYFFRKVYEHVISKKLGFVVLASYKNKNIAGAIFFHFGKKALYKYGASDRRYQHLRPSNLVIWEALKWYIQNGFKTLNFGITETENKGLLQFKRGWRGIEQTIYYSKYNIAKACFEKDSFRSKVSYPFFKYLPAPLLNIIGSFIYKHVA